MNLVKGIYNGKFVKLLEPVEAKQRIEVEVIFPNTEGKKILFVRAMQEEIKRMNKGFPLGGGPYYQSRGELYE